MSVLLHDQDRSARPDREVGQTLPARASRVRTPVVEIVIPVYNEARTVAANVVRLDEHLRSTMPHPFQITVVDNASTDDTWNEVAVIHRRLDHVAGLRLSAKGRGRALRAAWTASPAAIVAYMDVDLSTDLDGLLPLIAPLMSGHSDVAIGTRLARGSRIVRGRKRDAISRCYNVILRTALGVRFTDAQCGFKAVTRSAADVLLPFVQDDEWFFDTELLVLAERAGLRIYEVPVDWIDDPDSRVDVIDTARKDLQGVWRLRRSLRTLTPALVAGAERIGRGREIRRSAPTVRTGS